jgi:RNA polymerase sigma-70 factor, ECF subfamily
MAGVGTWMGETRDARAEARLVERASGGERGAFDALVRLHFAEVYGLLHRLVGNHEDAEDLAQDCFVKAYRSLRFYRGEGSFAAWLGRIAIHLARDHQRRRGRRGPVLPIDLVGEEPRAAAPGPVTELSRRELMRRVGEAVEDLPFNLRTAIVLRVLEGRDYEDVARATGMKPGTVRTQVMKARKRLMRALGPWIGKDEA